MEKVRSLFLAANPQDTQRLNLDREVREITAKIRASEYRDSLELISVWAVQPDDLLQSLNFYKPQIVHFSGHGSAIGEIVLADRAGNAKPVPPATLKKLFMVLKDNIQLVILNACYSKIQAEAIAEVIDCTIGMNDEIGDEAAITFVASFYRAIGFGRSIQEAFDQGVIALLLEGTPEEDVPELIPKKDVNPSLVFLVANSNRDRSVAIIDSPIRDLLGMKASVIRAAPPIGSGIILDLSHGQENWNGLTAWAAKAESLGIRTSKDPFSESLGVLVFALPFKKLLATTEINMIKSWVERGGGLLILGYYAADSHHGSNISRLTREWGISFNEDLLMPLNANEQDARVHVFRSDERYGVQMQIDSQSTHPLLRDVKAVVVVSGASINTDYSVLPVDLILKSTAETTIWRPEGPTGPDGMRPIIERWVKASSGASPVVAAFNAGRGKVAICATWKLTTLPYADNFQFTSNLIEWLRPT